MEKYSPKDIEPKWQKYWEKEGLHKTPEDVTSENKMYILPQLPYPSGSGLHVGHAEVYSACDIYARYQRMIGKKVLQVMGWDAFGLPAENYAIETGVHPRINTDKAIDSYRTQIKSLGISVDWEREVGSHNPDYYTWTQWFFLLMYKRGLAYRKEQAVNWCDSCKTVLANEQVTTEGTCERCETVVAQREMEQWFLKITDYADRLLVDLDTIDWPEESKKRQKDWIGRSEGGVVRFPIVLGAKQDAIVEVFTTRPDTLFGVTYMVLAPEHALVEQMKDHIQNWKEVEGYVTASKQKTELERQVEQEKTGVELKGVIAINPVNNENIPVWIADYVLISYGTGAIMAVPGHDLRDFAFAKKFDLPIREVVIKEIGVPLSDAVRRDGVSAVVVNRQGRILVLFSKTHGIYCLPGGGYSENDETAEKAIIREVAEESGYIETEVQEYLGHMRQNHYSLEREENRISNRKGFLLKLFGDGMTDVKFEAHENYENHWVEPEEAIKKLGSNSEKYGEEEFVKMAFVKNYQCFGGEGISINSDFLNGLRTKEAKEKMFAWLEKEGVGKRTVQYKLRDWSVSRQRFWGAPIPMIFNEERKNKKYTYVFIHGFQADGLSSFRTWLKSELEKRGHIVRTPDLPNTNKPNVLEQAEFLLQQVKFDEDTVIVAHSLGGPVAFRILEKLKTRVAKVILVDTVLRPEFNDKKRPLVEVSDSFEYNFEKIIASSDEFVLLADNDYEIIKKEHFEEMREKLGARLVSVKPNEQHFTHEKEEVVLEESLVSGLLPISENDLPVLLPDDVDFKPTGQSPLNYSQDFQKGVEKKYGKGWKREPDTLDTFMCSSWFYYRYLDPKNDKEFASPIALKKWMPVDFYLGGAEHVNGHLLYSRFITKVLYDAGYIEFEEPFVAHRHQGIILGADHRKMSKRWGNVINPTDVVREFGADTLRMYEMFMGPLEQTKPWSTDGVKGIRRFLDKVWALKALESVQNSDSDIEKFVHKTIKKVGEDLEAMKFNTAIAKMMELVNAMQKEKKIAQEHFENLLKILCPFAPHMCEELWHQLGHTTSITVEPWPQYDLEKIIEETVTLAVQVNGKVRTNITVDTDISEESAKKVALEDEKVVKWLEGKKPKKVIYVKGKLVSIVV